MAPLIYRFARHLVPGSIREHILQLIDRRQFDQSLQKKWQADTKALEINPRLQPLYETIHRYAWSALHRFPNLVNPENFNDRIHWLMLFDQRTLTIQCSDKLGVRDFVMSRLGPQYLTTLYNTFETADELEAATLPESCVVKTTHDSGTVFLSRPDRPMQVAEVVSSIRLALRSLHGTNNGEWPYAFVPPRVMVEELLEHPEYVTPPDIKFHCIDGQVAFIHYITDRDSVPRELIMTRDWQPLPVQLYFPVVDRDVACPDNLDELVRVAETLASGFRYVRVDLYGIGRRIVVGELTFFPMAGAYSGYGVYQVEPLMRFDLRVRNSPVSDGRVLLNEGGTLC